MFYVVAFLVGVVVGGICMFLYVMEKHAKSKAREKSAEELSLQSKAAVEQARQRQAELDKRAGEIERQRAELDKRVVSYQELQRENTLLKRDLQNIDVNVNKLHLDGELRAEKQKELDQRSSQLAQRYLDETVKAVVSAVGPSNFVTCKQRLLDVVERCRKIGFEVSAAREGELLTELKTEFAREVKKESQRQEQVRIKAQIIEEEKLKREVDRELKQLDRERAVLQAALDQALAQARDKHSAEIQDLQKRLVEAEEKFKRAISMAQQTKKGHVYVISNFGSFGDGIFKVGMTRRLKPEERVDELDCAAVPFPFEVHLMISCEDAPSLENALHQALNKTRVNKLRPHKEFFRSDIETICKVVREHHGEIEYQAPDLDGLEYKQCQKISEQDAADIERIYDDLDDELQPIVNDH